MSTTSPHEPLFIEVAGRQLCLLRGVDPEEMQTIGGDTREFPAWQFAGEECLQWYRIEAACVVGAKAVQEAIRRVEERRKGLDGLTP